MKQTPNYNLKKPDLTDYVNIDDINVNMDVIDTELHNIKETSSGNSKDIVDLKAHAVDYVKHPGFAVTSGTNSYMVTLNPKPAALVNGLGVVFRVGTSATGPCQLNVNGLGAKKIVDSTGEQVDDLLAGTIYTVRYNGTSFILQGKGGDGDGPDVIKEFDRIFDKPYSWRNAKYVYWVNTDVNRVIRDRHSSNSNGISIYDMNDTLIHSQLLSSGFDMHATPTEIVQFRGSSSFTSATLRIYDLNGTKLHDLTYHKGTSGFKLFGYDLDREIIVQYDYVPSVSGKSKFDTASYRFDGTLLDPRSHEVEFTSKVKDPKFDPAMLTGDKGMYRTLYDDSFGYGSAWTILLPHGSNYTAHYANANVKLPTII